jgi:hypothetical protein
MGRCRRVSRVLVRSVRAGLQGPLRLRRGGVGGGSVIGLATESGVVRGACIGAIIFSISRSPIESSRDLWHTSDSAVCSVLFMVRTSSLDYCIDT